ncbi:response regulator [Priestia megaterium]|uniref:response regulator n=1 Tax=Priestia megaterium TaxID=1404 RepID=UPI00300858F5
MDKYQITLLANVRNQLQEWTDQTEEIPHEEVYRFLHSISGTSATIGLHYLGDRSRELMEALEKNQKKTWDYAELNAFLLDIIKISYQDEIESVEDINKPLEINEKTANILLVDDDLSMLMYLKEQFEKQGWYVLATASKEKAITAFYEWKPDCFVVDVHMKDGTGFDILSFLRDKTKQMFIPIVMMSVDNQRKTRLQAFRLGADDFFVKPLDMEESVLRIGHHIERKKLLNSFSMVDELTGAYNRTYLKEIYSQQLSSYARSKEPFCLALLDLDLFKRVNDQYGHLMGDQVLQAFVEYMKHEIRPTDHIFRYGGEEFILLLPKTNIKEAETVLNRLLDSFVKKVFTHQSNSFYCSFSGGVVEVHNNEWPLEKALHQADEALYIAKESGRQKIVASSQSKLVKKRTLRMAIIDDDSIIRTMLKELLSKIDVGDRYEVKIEVFKDGIEFFESQWIHSSDQYFVILDGMMPKMDGLEVLQKLRQQKRHDQYTVVMLTSRNSEQDIQRALELGADDYMTKPFKLMELEARVRHLMKKVK